MRRREFFGVLGGAAAWPLGAYAQQMPVIGVLNPTSEEGYRARLPLFRNSLKDAGLVEGQNVLLEHRWADGDYARLPPLMADLVQRRVTVIYASGLPAALAARAAATTIPVVFNSGGDAVRYGLVTSLNRPGGTITGISQLSNALQIKRVELLRDLLPKATAIGFLANKDNPNADAVAPDLQAAVDAIGARLFFFTIDPASDLNTAFANMKQRQIDALLVSPDPFFNSRANQIAALAERYAVPTIFAWREFVEAGGLVSYGASNPDIFRQIAIYISRIINGEKAADLPVLQPTKYELVINLKTAKLLGLTIPPTLLARADEVIE